MDFGREPDARTDEELLVATVARWPYTRLKTLGAERVLDRWGDPRLAARRHRLLEGEPQSTVVRAVLRAAPAGGTTVTLTAIAKEGLIRQHAAEQALEQVEAALDAEPGPHA